MLFCLDYDLIMILNMDTQSKLEEEFTFEQIGGHQIVGCKPVFTADSNYLLVASGTNIRQYIVENGNLINSFTTNYNKNIVWIHLNQQKSQELIIIYEDGVILYWHLEKRKVKAEYQLNLDSQKLTFGQIIDQYAYFILSRDNISEIYYSHLDQTQLKKKLNNSNGINGSHSVAFGPTNKPHFCAFVKENVLFINKIPIGNSSPKTKHFCNVEYVCVACHPSDDIIATGDQLGRITLWYNDFFESIHPTKTIMHWHSKPPSDLCFSVQGTHLYSVGQEMVLVKWDITANNCGEKNFISRIGMPMKYVTCDSKHNYLATSHIDNSILIIDSQMSGTKTKLEGMSTGDFAHYNLSTNLIWNNKLNCIVLPSKPGYLQFYSQKVQKIIYELDVIKQNLISNEKERQIILTQITKVSITDDSKWLVTLEFRQDLETLPEIRLKFWELINNKYELNSMFHLPHKRSINCLAFSHDGKRLISTSDDKSLKIWQLNKDLETKNKSWQCIQTSNLNSTSIPTLASWSSDDSILAIVFDDFITLWETNNDKKLELKETLVTWDNKTSFKFLTFGSYDNSHFLVEAKQDILRVWDLLYLKG